MFNWFQWQKNEAFCTQSKRYFAMRCKVKYLMRYNISVVAGFCSCYLCECRFFFSSLKAIYLSCCVFACANKIICAKMSNDNVHKCKQERSSKQNNGKKHLHVQYIYSPHKYAHHHGVVIYYGSISLSFPPRFCSTLQPYNARRKKMEIKTQQYSKLLFLFVYFFMLK